MAATPGSGLLDLEKELSCSICTDILFQPLTALDCLHTFCGSCLKEWFGFQALRAQQENSRSHSRHPKPVEYTCPSCRASVRDARPDPRVTTLLDMYVQANPAKDKSPTDKEEMRKIWKSGDPVFPQGIAPTYDHSTNLRGDSDDEEDRRLVDEVRELSLQELSGPHNGHGTQSQRQRRHLYAPEGSHSRRRSRTPTATRDGTTERPQQSIGLEHQNSLRILLRHSNLDSAEIQEDIMRLIVEEGLLDGIDLDNLQADQEEQLSQRIAIAYRRLLRQRARQQHGPRVVEPQPDPALPAEVAGNSVPPSSHRAVASQAIDFQPNTTNRSSLDVSVRPSHDSQRASSSRQRSRSSNERHPIRPSGSRQHSGSLSYENYSRPAVSPQARENPALPSASGPAELPTQSYGFPQALDVSVSCDRCGRPHIEYDVHYTCETCASDGGGTFDLCSTCYLTSRGCLNWYGFGHAAWPRWERLAAHHNNPADMQPPHALEARKYVKNPTQGINTSTSPPILETGAFCNMCGRNASSCFWRCNTCNEGEWGYCNTCVGQARHCTHALESVELVRHPLPHQQPPPAHLAPYPPTSKLWSTRPIAVSASCDMCHQPIPQQDPRMHCRSCNDGDFDLCLSCYRALTASGRIGPQDGEQGWRKCPQNHRMLVVGFDPPANATPPANAGSTAIPQPLWRRVVRADVVAGWALLNKQFQLHVGKPPELHRVIEALKANQSPPAPSMTYGGRRRAKWSRVPEEGARDELMFPRGAELREVVQINPEWSWGVYCREGGLFPGAYVVEA